MYLAVVAVIAGQALLLGQPALLLYATAVGLAMAVFVHGYEEPTLHRQFGAQYQAYRQAVPAWWPRRHPWQEGQANQSALSGTQSPVRRSTAEGRGQRLPLPQIRERTRKS
jgi:hypothetical protein